MGWRWLRWCRLGALGWILTFPAEASAEEPSIQDRVRALYEKISAAVDSGRKEEALAPLRAAWELRKSYKDICNIGQIEAELSRWRDAAESLTLCQRMMPERDKATIGKANQALLDKARSKVAALDFTANVPGAEVFVNGKLVAKLPLDRSVFLDPGWYGIEVRAPGYDTDTRALELVSGDWMVWESTLQAAEVVVVRSAPTLLPPRQNPALAPPVLAPKASSPQVSTSTASGLPGSQGYSQEESGKSAKPLIVAGTSLGLLGLGIASVSFGTAYLEHAHADGIMVQVQGSKYERPCSLAEFASSCREADRSVGKAFAFSTVGFGGMVISATGWALVTYELFWSSASKGRANVQGAIVMTPGGGALRVGGSF